MADISIARVVPCLASIVFALVCSVLASGQAAAEDGVASVVKVRGSVQVARGGTELPAAAGFALELHDKIETGAGARVKIQFADGSMVSLAEKSALSIDQFSIGVGAKSRSVILSALAGIVDAVVTKSNAGNFDYRIRTADCYSAVRGTHWIVAVQAAITSIFVLDGAVEVGSKTGNRVVVPSGKSVAAGAQSGIGKVQPTPPAALQHAVDATAEFAGSENSNAPAVAPAPATPAAPANQAPTVTPPAHTTGGGGGGGKGGGSGGHGM